MKSEYFRRNLQKLRWPKKVNITSRIQRSINQHDLKNNPNKQKTSKLQEMIAHTSFKAGHRYVKILFLAAVSSSRSDVVTYFVSPSVRSSVTKEFFLSLKSFRGVFMVFKGCLKLKKFQGCFKKVLRVFTESFKVVSRKFKGRLKEVSRNFQ